jgi:TonB-linked SusC/RagA family outer membrane protein
MEMLSSTPPINSPGVVDNKLINLPYFYGMPTVAFMKGWHHDYGNNLNGSVRLNYKMDYLTKGLSARAAFSYKNYNNQIQKYETDGISYEARRANDGSILFTTGSKVAQMRFGEEVRKNRRIYIEAGLDYARTFGSHNITGLILYNQSKYHDPELTFRVPNGYQGVVGRITYGFKNRYLMEYNLGWNGTENFAEGKRFGYFPAYSMGWVPSEEPFFPENDYLTFIKIRGAYGEVGNDKIGGDRFLYRPTAYTYTGDPAYYFGEMGIITGQQNTHQSFNGSNEGKLGNPDLTWEVARKSNIGLDMKLWKSKLYVTFDLFQEKRDNILCNRGTIPEIVGANFPAYNLGKMKNSGWESEISYYDSYKDFRYFVKANYSYAHNVVEFKDEATWAYPYRYETGQRFGQSYGYVAEGLYNTWEEVNDVNRPIYMWSNNKIQPGDVKYKDVNSDGKIDDNDQVPIGYSNFPEKMFGLSLGGSFRNFDFSLLFQGAANVSTFPSRRTMKGFYTDSGAGKELLKSWSQERYDQGLEIVYPRYTTEDHSHNYLVSTYWLEDASYVRLKNAEIGYTIKKEALKKLGLSSIRIYVNGNNLLTWCNLLPGQDPEYMSYTESYPVTRTFNWGLNVNF